MSNLSIGNAVPDFTATATGDQEISLSSLKGKNIVIYFYPKDSTPGCTTEAEGRQPYPGRSRALRTGAGRP